MFFILDKGHPIQSLVKHMRVLVTGANGFVGRALATFLHARSDYQVVGLLRQPADLGYRTVQWPSLPNDRALEVLLTGTDVIVHCAASAHRPGIPECIHQDVNVDLTISLARAAVHSGCRRFVFVSTIGVLGSSTTEIPFSENTSPSPNGAYAQTKLLAEQELQKLAGETGLEVVVVRPPLVYGPGAPGNFGALVHWVSRGRPLPFGSVITNRRSYIAIDNLVSFLTLSLEHPLAAGQAFVVSDGEDVSTAELVRRIAAGLERQPCLYPVPVSWMWRAAYLVRREDMATRLLGNLQIDDAKAQALLGWKPPISMEEQFRKLRDSSSLYNPRV